MPPLDASTIVLSLIAALLVTAIVVVARLDPAARNQADDLRVLEMCFPDTN